MKEREIERLLDEYVDGKLTPDAAEALETRLQQSVELREKVRRRRELQKALGTLPESIDPPPGVWSKIDAEIDRVEAKAGGWRTLLLAATLAGVAVVASFFLRQSPGPDGSIAETPSAGVVATEASSGSPRVVSEAERALVEAKDELKRALDAQRELLPPETRELVDRNLLIIEEAIEEIHVAMDADPNDAELNRILVAYHQRELELLEQATKAASKL